LSAAADRGVLDLLHGILAKELIKRIEDGSATASDLSVAAKLLRDNGVYLIGSKADNLADGLAESLPFRDTPQSIQTEDQYVQ
jgi:hypothetical protein